MLVHILLYMKWVIHSDMGLNLLISAEAIFYFIVFIQLGMMNLKFMFSYSYQFFWKADYILKQGILSVLMHQQTNSPRRKLVYWCVIAVSVRVSEFLPDPLILLFLLFSFFLSCFLKLKLKLIFVWLAPEKMNWNS